MGNNCDRCYWADRCPEAGNRCEYFDPVLDIAEDESEDNLVLQEYLDDLASREEDYREVVREMED